MAVGGFVGGLVAGGIHAGPLIAIVISLIGSVSCMSLMGPDWKEQLPENLRGILALCAFVPIPFGFLGYILIL